MNSIDITTIIDGMLPKSWTCPHCKKKHKMDRQAEAIFMEHFKVIRQCGRCSYLHLWELKLTDDLKQRVIQQLLQSAT